MTDDGVTHRNILKSNFYLVTAFVTINKIVYYQHLLVSFEELRERCSKAFRLLSSQERLLPRVHNNLKELFSLAFLKDWEMVRNGNESRHVWT